MPQSHCQNLVHIVFSTKHRAQLLKPPVRSELHAYLAEIVRRHKSECYRAGGVEDHVHLAVLLHSTVTVASLVEQLKTSSSKWMKTRGHGLAGFSWQNGYGAFSTSPQYRDHLIQYIDAQEDHHKRMSFQDEYRGFLQRYKIAYDEKYVWD